MQSNVDDIVATLSVQIFRIPEATVKEARDASSVTEDRSLIDELSLRGFLNDLERDFLQDLSQRLADPETLTADRQHAKSDDKTAAMAEGALGYAKSLRNALYDRSHLHKEGEDRYAQIREEGRGGMGRVLSVWDTRMGREVALKELLPGSIGRSKKDGDSGQARDRVVARFLQEAQVTGRLQHPAIIPVYEIGERADGTLYYTMKFVRGQTLKQAIVAATTLEARMALLPHYVSLCQAMAYAHANGVIHRDLKPSNVMIGEFGETLVIDWGLAKEMHRADVHGDEEGAVDAVADGDEFHGLTMEGQLLGTPHYMSPEQAAGRHEFLDERSDVYALGAVLYQLITGVRPYETHSRLDVLRKVVTEPPPAPESICPEIPLALTAICKRAMAQKPSERYRSAKSLANEILRFQSGAVVAAHTYGLRDHAARLIKKHRPVVLTGVVSALLLIGVLSYTVYTLHRGRVTEHSLRVKSETERYGLSIGLAQQSLEEFQYDHVEKVLDDCPPEYRGWEWGRLAYVAANTRQTYLGHPETVAGMALSPDGKYLVTADFKGFVLLWSLPDFQRVREYKVSDEAWDITFHPNSREFATTGVEGIIKRWDVASGALLGQYTAPGTSCSTILYTLDGRSILSAGTDGAISQWDLATGKIVRRFPVPNPVINRIALSPDGRWLAAGDEKGMVLVYDWESGAKMQELAGHTNSRQHGVQGTIWVAFSADGATLLSSGCDATAKSWNWELGTLNFTLEGFVDRVWTAEFTPDGTTVVTTSSGMVQFWDGATGLEKPSWIRGEGVSKRALFLPGGSRIVTVGGSAKIRRWRVGSDEEECFLPGNTVLINSVRFSPDGNTLAGTTGQWMEGGDGRVLLWENEINDAVTQQEPLRVLDGGVGWTHPVAFHPDGRLVSAGDRTGMMLTWDRHTGERINSRKIPEYTNGLRCLAYSPDGQRYATAGWADEILPTVSEWATDTGLPIRTYSGLTMEIDSVAYSPDGRYLAAGSRDGTVRVWDVSSGTTYRELVNDRGWVYGVTFSPDGRYLAASYNQPFVVSWDLKSGRPVQEFGGLLSRANKVTYSPDGQRIASCDTNMVKIWNATTGAALMTLPHGAYDVAFSPDGMTLASAGSDGRVGLWHALPWTNEGVLSRGE